MSFSTIENASKEFQLSVMIPFLKESYSKADMTEHRFHVWRSKNYHLFGMQDHEVRWWMRRNGYVNPDDTFSLKAHELCREQ